MSEKHSSILNVRPEIYRALTEYRDTYFPESSLASVATYLLAVELELANMTSLHMVNQTLMEVKRR